METNFKNIFEYKSSKVGADKTKVLSVVNNELSKFNFEDDYLREGGLEIISCNEVKFYTCTLENFTDTRNIIETNRPNKYGVHAGNKRISEFNPWDYKLSYKKEFQNADDNQNIEESHHAVGCGTCKQHGKIRCSSCFGAGDITCSSCSGHGEKECNTCSGRGETKCWSCSGKGSKEIGYGENKKIERCSSCSGRGYKPCSSCRNGYVTCSSCSGRGRVTCYTCHGSGEVTCYQCDGYCTMDHYFIVNAKFINLHQTLFVTNPLPGFDYSKANEIGFSIQHKLFEFKENRFKNGYFDELQSHPLYRQICAFFDFNDSEKTKLISSRITFCENKYTEVSFLFYGESYIIYFDNKFNNSYYGGKKPSDQYELDLLSKSIKSFISNDLDVAKRTIEKLSKYDFISINEKYLITAIEDTKNIYTAKNHIDKRNYSNSESIFRIVSEEKKKESDFKLLIQRLNRIYLTNTIVVGLICFLAIVFKLIDKNSQFIFWNILASVGIIIISLLVNRSTRSIQLSRVIVFMFFILQFFGIIYIENTEGNKIISERALFNSFDSFKRAHYTVKNPIFPELNLKDSIILIGPTGEERRNYYLPKGKPYLLNIGGGQRTKERIAESKMYLNIDQRSFENSKGTYKVNVALKGNSGFSFNIEVNYGDIIFDYDDNEIEVSYISNSIEEYKINNIKTTFISNSSWKAIKDGAKLIELSKTDNNKISMPMTDEESSLSLNDSLTNNEESNGNKGKFILLGEWTKDPKTCDDEIASGGNLFIEVDNDNERIKEFGFFDKDSSLTNYTIGGWEWSGIIKANDKNSIQIYGYSEGEDFNSTYSYVCIEDELILKFIEGDYDVIGEGKYYKCN